MTSGLIVGDGVDAFHPWDPNSVAWTEAVWFGAYIPEQAMSIYVYNWFRPVLNIYGGGCIVWDSTGALPWEALFYQYDVNRPLRGSHDLSDLTLDCGTRIQAVVPGKQYRVGFTSARAVVSLDFEATSTGELTEREGTEEFFAGHLDEPGRYRGFVEIDGQRHVVDCYGIRDRSWGPRVIGEDLRLGYCHGESERLNFLAFSRPASGREEVLKGYVSHDGERVPVKSGFREVHYDDGTLSRIVLSLLDARGRRLEGQGTPVNQFSYLPYPNMVSTHYLMRWEFPDGVVYGEEQDLTSVGLWRHRADRPRSSVR